MENAGPAGTLSALLALTVTVIALTACGGGIGEGESVEALQPMTTTHAEAKVVQAPSTMNSGVQASMGGASASHDSFGNFNPDLWNSHQWYECNCARNPATPPVSTPWKMAH